MKINLGYACISESLDVTSSSLMTYTHFTKNNDYDKLHKIIKSNLDDLEKILLYNIKNDIKFFRLTSKLIPLATKDEVVFEYLDKYKGDFKKLSKLCNKMRIGVHPDQFTVINSTNNDVVLNSVKNLEYHFDILKALDIKNKVMIVHVGSSVFGKDKSIHRFIKNFRTLPLHLQKCIVIENDDKVYNILDCLYISKKLNIPFVLDYHHYLCNNDGEDINKYYHEIFSTWKGINPKVHFSSPKSKLKKEFRTHHDYIDVDEFIKFIESIKHLQFDIDIMLEAKKKDESLFRLIRLLKYKTNYKIDGTTIIL